MTSFMRFTHILCPTDYSQPAASGLEHAIALAGWYDARVTVLHVCSGTPDEADRTHLLQTVAAARDPRASTPLDTALMQGDPARSILREAERLSADLLVMGTHGTSGFKRLILGSVTEKVLRQAAAPVLTVPPAAASMHAHLPFERVLCAVDFSPCSLSALEYARSVAAQSGACLIAVHALEWPWEEPPAPDFEELPAVERAALRAFRRRREQEAGERLAAMVASGERCGVLARVAHGKAYAAVLRVAAEEHADLIVLGVRGRGGAERAFFGSTTNHVVRQAGCPVLTVYSRSPASSIHWPISPRTGSSSISRPGSTSPHQGGQHDSRGRSSL
jgi:nucleotide-binding universal stress UspA family protein